MKRFAIFISGSGTNMANIVKSVQKRVIKRGEVAVVFSDNPKAYGLVRAKRLKVPVCTFSPKGYASRAKYEQAILTMLKYEKVDFIVLAGYMRLVGQTLLKAYKNKIINIHPALLPAFPGMHGIKDAYDYGVKVTGVTVHVVDDGMDTGPIILQEAVEIKEKDTLAQLEKRIHKTEYAVYPKAVQRMIDGKVKVRGRKVNK